MGDQKQLFFDLVDEVEASGRFHQILRSQQLKYHLHPFKISWINCQSIKKIYQSLTAKSQSQEKPPSDPDSWNQNERRVFIWFIIFFTYLQDISPASISEEEWVVLSKTFFQKSPKFLQFHCLNMVKLQAKISWTKEEDEHLVRAVREEDESGKWNEVSKRIFYNSDFKVFKSPKHCRERWLNHLDDKKKRGNWTNQQDLCILKYVTEYGKHWCKIVPVLRDTRTEHMIKNRYNSLIHRQRKNKKEREEHLRYKLIKQLKKTISNQKKRARELQNQLQGIKKESLEDVGQVEAVEKAEAIQQGGEQRVKIKSEYEEEQYQVFNENDIYPFEEGSYELIKQEEQQKDKQSSLSPNQLSNPYPPQLPFSPYFYSYPPEAMPFYPPQYPHYWR